MKDITAGIIAGIGALLLLAGVIWDFVVYLQNWDVLLTYSDRFTLYWKPTVMEIVGYILVSAVVKSDS